MINRIVLAAALTTALGGAWAQPASALRGQLLYETHCITCHNTKMHWRDQRLVTDWPGLLAQVRRWQATAHLDWSDADIEAVAQHLNDRIYRLPRPERRAGTGAADGG